MLKKWPGLDTPVLFSSHIFLTFLFSSTGSGSVLETKKVKKIGGPSGENAVRDFNFPIRLLVVVKETLD